MNAAKYPSLREAAKLAAGRAYGLEAVEHEGHAVLVETALRAFADDDRALFFIEMLAPSGNMPRSDLIVLHPAVGCVVIECKGVPIDAILGVEGVSLRLRRRSQETVEDPFAQAEKVMYHLKNDVLSRLRRGRPMLSRTAALPQVDRGEFEARFGVRWPADALFADAFASPDSFRRALLSLAARGRAAANRRTVWYANGAAEIERFLRCRLHLHSPRPTRLAEQGDDGTGSLGKLIEQIEQADKLPTRQQQEIGDRDLRGGHWLFRGVAGSGKSLMLALSAAQTLQRMSFRTTDLFGRGTPPRVLACCFNKTLVHFLRGRIESCHARFAWGPPPAGSLAVTHFDGLLKTLGEAEPALRSKFELNRRDERAAKVAAAFDALPEERRRAASYDAVYVDEAQDLRPNEVRLLRRLCRPDAEGRRTLAIFYDNAQNIYGAPTPVWKELGVEIVGRTAYLDRCQRNTRQILEPAFNVLVGSNAPPGERARTRQFAEVANLRERGLIDERSDGTFRVRFSDRDDGPPPTLDLYPTRAAEAAGVAGHVRRLIRDEGVLPSDVLVLTRSFRDYPDLEDRLRDAVGPSACVRFVGPKYESNKALPLIEDGVLTASTVASAKGYDAAVVIFAGVDRIEADTVGRALFYVAATRAKHALILTGVDTAESGRLLPEVRAAFG